MSSPLNQFNRVARWYDRMGALVFGQSIRIAQLHFLGHLPKTGSILVLGGGTGWILRPLIASAPRCTICYVEASDAMISTAKQYLPASPHNVELIHGTETSLRAGMTYDAVITNFYLDVFSDQSLSRVLPFIHSRLKNRGLWIVTDFVQPANLWQQALLWMMYRFFTLTCHIEAKKLPGWREQMNKLPLNRKASQSFFGKFILAELYEATV